MKKRKVLSAVLAAALVLGAVSALENGTLNTVAFAEDELQAGDSFIEAGLQYAVLNDGTLTVSCPIDEKDTLTEAAIPSEINGIKVTGIDENAFFGCESLTAISIPDSVTDIGDSTFQSCTSLTEVTIPDSVKRINKSTFWFCTNLESITLGNSITSIDQGAFFQCESLKAITIPDSVTSIDKNAFQYCTSFESITIPDSVTSIGLQAFFNCTSLTDVYYTGTEEQWKEIEITNGNDDLINAAIHYKSIPDANEPTTSDPTDQPETSTPVIPPASNPTTGNTETSEPTTSEPATTESAVFESVIDNAESLDETTKEIVGGITVTDSNGAFEDGTVMNISNVKSTDGLFSFDITFTKDGKEVQPNGKVTVKVPVPEAMKNGDIYVYHYDDEENAALVPSKVEDGFAIFETDKFSVYALSNELIENGTADTGSDTNSETSAAAPSTPAASDENNSNPSTGIGLAVIPVFITAGAAAISASKKRK